MARPSSPPILTQIRNSRFPSEQIVALKALKNDIVGYQQKKEMWVGLGVVEPIVRIMISNKSQGKQNSKERYDGRSTPDSNALSEKETVRLQALCVIGSLANGGPLFLGPLHAASVLPAILSNICPSTNPPQVVLSALRALSNLVDSITLAPGVTILNANTLADCLFSHPSINSLCKILSQSSAAPDIQSQISQATSLISILCRDERHQSSLANGGVLEALAVRLASVVVSQGLVIPGAEILAYREGRLDNFPLPAPENTDIAGILEAIAVIVADSKFRASQLVYSNAIMAVFPTTSPVNFQPNQCTKAAWAAFSAADPGSRQSQPSALDYMIPYVPLNRTKSASALSSAFPPLGTPGSFEHLVQIGGPRIPTWSHPSSFETGVLSQDNLSTDISEPESPLIAYLIWLTRSTQDLERLMAAFVLTVLFKAGLTSKSRETALGLLIVPLLVQLLRDEKNGSRTHVDKTTNAAERTSVEWRIRERAPAVLAMLIVDSEYLQKSAYDAGIIKRLSELIKTAYDSALESSHSHAWSPITGSNFDSNSLSTSQASRLEQASQSPLLVHRIKVRESTLRAIAALVPFKDEYRKALIDHGIIPYVVESLKTYPGRPSMKPNDKSEKTNQLGEDNKFTSQEFGINPISVLIAACGAVRHISRSVSILRTTLIDNGVVMPVFALLQHSDIDVQISATAATCNLVMDFSPMRETIAAAGVLKILCEHAHSGNVRLRLNAMWALKHLVHTADMEVKKSCLEELGEGWLVQLICDDTEDESLSSARPRSAVSGYNEDTDKDDVRMEQFENEDEFRIGEGFDAFGYGSDTKQSFTGSRPPSSRGVVSQPTSTRMAALRESETNPTRNARKDDIAVQEQGLDFIRNLIGGFNNVGTSETSEMIDFLLNALGQDQIFEILASKLRYKIVNPYNKRSSTANSETRVVPPQAEIIAAVEYILVHMAASIPRHRQLVIAQTEILKLLVPHFNHPNKEVRLALCWLAINLTSVDDARDGQACAQRTQELKKLGFLSKLENLEHDVELDVRERAKTAIWQMKQGY